MEQKFPALSCKTAGVGIRSRSGSIQAIDARATAVTLPELGNQPGLGRRMGAGSSPGRARSGVLLPQLGARTRPPHPAVHCGGPLGELTLNQNVKEVLIT